MKYSSSYYIVGAETADYLQRLIYEVELEAYRKSRKKKKHHSKYGNLYSSKTS